MRSVLLSIAFPWSLPIRHDSLTPARLAIAAADAAVMNADQLAEAVAAYRLLFGPLFVRDPAEVVLETPTGPTMAVIDPPDRLLSPALVRQAILVAWAAGSFDDAAAFGSLPTQRFLNRDDQSDDRAARFWTFALASAARGNLPAYERATANARQAVAANQTLDASAARGAILPAMAAIDAILAGKGRVATRQVEKLVRFHVWQHREASNTAKSFDLLSTAMVRWAELRGVPITLVNPVVPHDW